MSEENRDNARDKPRQPSSLQGLLKFALEGKNYAIY